MKIVEYKEELAKKVADMWNKSGSNWGDETELRTESDVINTEKNSGNLNLFLALEKDDVVGYCSYSEYQHDEGASYLSVLNVIPECHGLGFGKALILRTVEEAIQSKWPRFDLFTWSGNMKAMPLYKKCGFFWERKVNTVHLMNFIPYLYQTEALTHYLEDIDWYKDSKRVIDMNPDGNRVNDFDYFRYDFENEKTKLAFEFEKTGRGLRLIDTPDYSIEMSLASAQPISNLESEVTFKIVNKSKKPLNIKLQGKENQYVRNNILDSFDVVDEYTIVKNVYINELLKPLDKMRTYPYVDVDVFINGLPANFRIGLEPKSPLEVNLKIIDYNHFVNEEHIGYLEIENNLSNPTTFHISLPNTLIKTDDISIQLASKEKRSLELTYTVLDTGFYNELATITYDHQSFTRPVKDIVKGIDKCFNAINDDKAYVINGNYTVIYSKDHHTIEYVNSFDSELIKQEFRVPQIGLPYSLEFSNATPKITFPNPHSMDLTFESKTFKDVLAIVHLVNLNGILKINYELLNKGPKRELALAFNMFVSMDDTYLPYDKKILDTKDPAYNYLLHVENDYIDENWIYNYKTKSALVWDKSENISIAEWVLKSSKDHIVLNKDESYITKDYYITYAHPTLEDVRCFAGNKEDRDIVNFLTVDVNHGNPFVKDDVEIKVSRKKKTIFEGDFTVDGIKKDLKETLTTSPGLKTIKINSTEESFDVKRLTFKPNGHVQTNIIDEDIYEVNNGVLSFKVSKTYSDALISLNYNHQEWLDSNYPDPKPRAWWGKFSGGISMRIQRMQDIVVLAERRTVEFVEMIDNFKNKWTGLKTTVYFEKEEEFKGIILESYTLTLPNVPVVYTFNNTINKSGKRITRNRFNRHNILKCDDDYTKVLCNLEGKLQKCHSVGIEKSVKKLLSFESTREHKLYLYNATNDLEFDTQKQYTAVFSSRLMSLSDNKSKQLTGDFYIFSKEDLTKECFEDFDHIKFDV